jgi:hypothetical protein
MREHDICSFELKSLTYEVFVFGGVDMGVFARKVTNARIGQVSAREVGMNVDSAR